MRGGQLRFGGDGSILTCHVRVGRDRDGINLVLVQAQRRGPLRAQYAPLAVNCTEIALHPCQLGFQLCLHLLELIGTPLEETL